MTSILPEKTVVESPCPCQSGREYTACCGRPAVSEGAYRPESGEVYLLLSDACQGYRDGRFIHTLTALRQILAQAPLHYGALRLAMACPNPTEVFDVDALKTLLIDAMAGYPDDTDIICDASILFIVSGEEERAESLLREIIAEQAQHFRAHSALGQLTQRRHQLDLAEYHYRQACYQRQFAPGILNELAHVLGALGRKDEAEHYFRMSLAQAPGAVGTLLNWCRMEESRNCLEKAWHLWQLATEANPGYVGVHIAESLLHRRDHNYRRSIDVLDRIDPEVLDPRTRALWGYERCRTFDKMGQFDLAFESAAAANTIKLETFRSQYQAGPASQHAESLKRFFTRTRIRKLTVKDTADARSIVPVFICGFTRSGTSMIEQILSAHSNICGGDELPFIHDLAVSAKSLLKAEDDFPQCLLQETPSGSSSVQGLRRRYLSRLRMTSILEPGVGKFTDKMPTNEMYLGLIRCLFPEAHIIHVVRHPLDVVLSTYFIDATHGGNCGYDLTSAARHYRLLWELAEHYRAKSGVKLLRVRYEDVVADCRKQVEKMLRYLGEPFEEACLAFHANPRYSRTASYAQVTEKLYNTSVYRYRNYRRHLDDIIPILEDVIAAMGYDIAGASV